MPRSANQEIGSTAPWPAGWISKCRWEPVEKPREPMLSDLLASVDALTNSDVEGLHVAVNGHGAIVVLDADPLAVAGSWAGIDDGAVHSGEDWGTDSVSDVDARVERAPTWAKAGGEGAFCWAGYGRSARSLVSGGASLRSLNCLVELLGEVSDRFSLSYSEDPWGSGCHGISCCFGAVLSILESVRLVSQVIVNSLCLGASVFCLKVCSCCATNACGGHCSCSDGYQCQAPLRRLRGGDLAVTACAPLSLASHEFLPSSSQSPNRTRNKISQSFALQLWEVGYVIVTFLLPTRCNSSVSEK